MCSKSNRSDLWQWTAMAHAKRFFILHNRWSLIILSQMETAETQSRALCFLISAQTKSLRCHNGLFRWIESEFNILRADHIISVIPVTVSITKDEYKQNISNNNVTPGKNVTILTINYLDISLPGRKCLQLLKSLYHAVFSNITDQLTVFILNESTLLWHLKLTKKKWKEKQDSKN